MRDVKIQCTIGPACNDPEILAEMMEAGMDVARVNLSHGSAKSQADKLENFRRAAKMTGKEQAAIMFDIRGPEIRVKEIPGERLFAAEGETLVLRCEDMEEHDEDARGCHNTDAHLRSSIIGRSETIVVEDGVPDLGEFGFIYFIDFDQTRSRTRTVQVMVIGE